MSASQSAVRVVNADCREMSPCKRCGCTLRYASSRHCVDCVRAYARRYSANNRDKCTAKGSAWRAANLARTRAIELKSKRVNWAVTLLNKARSNSKERRHPAPTITVEWILSQPETCPFTGIKLINSADPDHAGANDPRQPSLDRVDARVIYTADNTILTCLFWNILRGTLSVEQAKANLLRYDIARDEVRKRTT